MKSSPHSPQQEKNLCSNEDQTQPKINYNTHIDESTSRRYISTIIVKKRREKKKKKKERERKKRREKALAVEGRA